MDYLNFILFNFKIQIEIQKDLILNFLFHQKDLFYLQSNDQILFILYLHNIIFLIYLVYFIKVQDYLTKNLLVIYLYIFIEMLLYSFLHFEKELIIFYFMILRLQFYPKIFLVNLYNHIRIFFLYFIMALYLFILNIIIYFKEQYEIFN